MTAVRAAGALPAAWALRDGLAAGRVRILQDGTFWFDHDGDFDDLAPGASRATGFRYEVSDPWGETDEAYVTLVVTRPDLA